MPTVSITDWDLKQTASIGTLSDGSSFSGLVKVQPVRVTWGNSSTNSGDGDCAFTNDINSQDELVVTQPDESTTRPYEVAYFDDTAQEAWLWVYGSWNSDGSDQVVVACGGGDGTDYSSPRNASKTNGTGNNPWGQSGVNVQFTWHLNSDLGFDSSPNSNNGTVNGASNETSTTQFESSARFDGTDDDINAGLGAPDGNITAIAWFNPDDKSTLTRGLNSYNGPNSAYFILAYQTNDNALRFDIDDGEGGPIAVGSTDISNNTWHHAAGTYDGSTSKVFLDGVLDGSTSGSVTPNYDNTILGDDNDNNNEYDGVVDAVRLYGEHKSDNFVQADYDASPKGGQVFFSWSGEESTATTDTAVKTSFSFTPKTATELASLSGTFNVANQAETTLNGSIGSSDNSIDVNDASPFPTPPFRATINTSSSREIIQVNAVSSNTLQEVERGLEDTSAQSWSDSVKVENRWTKGTYDRLVNELK